MDKTLIVAPIGSPFNWREVEYRAPWVSESSAYTVKSRTSIKLIYDVLSSNGLEPKVVVFALDTLAANSRWRPGPDRQTIMGTECLPDPFQDLHEGEQEPARYGDFQAKVGECVKRWFEKETGIDVNVIVLPGFGEIPYISREGEGEEKEKEEKREAAWILSPELGSRGVEPMEYLMGLQALHLVREMESVFRGGEAQLHIDLTHGINYAGYSLYRATMFASRVYSAANKAVVDLKVYNSEPYVPGVSRLNVWIVRRETIKPRAAASRLVYASIADKTHDNEYVKLSLDDVVRETKELKGEVRKRLKNELRELLALNSVGWPAAAAVIIGAPLLLAQAWASALEGGLDRLDFKDVTASLISHFPFVRVFKDKNGSSVTIEHVAALNYGHVRKLLSLMALTKYAGHAARIEGVMIDKRSSSLCSSGEKNVAVVSLKGLKVIGNELIAGPSQAIVDNEVSNFEAAARGERVGGREYELAAMAYKCAKTIDDSTSKKRILSSARGGREVDRRVFAAHAGLMYNLLTFESDGKGDPSSSVKVYYDPCLLNTVYGLAKTLLSVMARSIFEG